MTKVYLVILSLIPALTVHAKPVESVCYGTTSHGRLQHGVKLPSSGDNFTTYGYLPSLMGRTYVHSKVRDTIIDAYAILNKSHPDKVYKYAETGYKEGGKFKPHKTHQNGLSVDFMVPVVDKSGRSVHLSTHSFNRYGYDIEFDQTGKYKGYQIDFEALGAHLVALHKAAKANGIDIWRVLFDPKLQPKLYMSRHGAYIRKHIMIPNKPSWVRHDEHYHVDFKVNCEPR